MGSSLSTTLDDEDIARLTADSGCTYLPLVTMPLVTMPVFTMF